MLRVALLRSSSSSTPCWSSTKSRRSPIPDSKCCYNSKRSPWESSEVTGGGENIEIWPFWCASFSRFCQLRDLWTHESGHQRLQITCIVVPEETPIPAVHGEFDRGQNDVPNVEIWPVEDANFLKNSVNQPKPGVLEKCFQGPPYFKRWFLTMLYPAGGPQRTSRRRWVHFINICTRALYVKMAENTKIGQFWSTIARAPLNAQWSSKQRRPSGPAGNISTSFVTEFKVCVYLVF